LINIRLTAVLGEEWPLRQVAPAPGLPYPGLPDGDSKEVDRMSRRNFKINLVALLACYALLLASLGCESVTGPDSTPSSTLSTSGGEASFSEMEGLGG
jgi:hypothetical protein